MNGIMKKEATMQRNGAKMMKLTILGFMGGYPASGIGTSSYLLESEDGFRLLMDVGSNAVLSLEKHVDPLEVDALILTHYHPDHIADLGVLQHVFLIKQRSDNQPKRLLPVYGHTESELAVLRGHEGASEAKDYSGEEEVEIGPFRITFLKTLHPVPCYALRIQEKATGKVLVFTADSGYMQEFIDFSRNADVFLADTNFYKGQENHHVHMTSKEVGEIARKAQVKESVLTHLPPYGDWQRLLKEAQEAAGDVPVSLAAQDRVLYI